MVKSINDITINDHDLVERTGKVDHLKKWYNILPARLFTSRIVKVLNEVVELLSGKEDDPFDEKQWEVLSFIRINRLKVNYYGVLNIFSNRSRFNILRRLIPRKSKKPINEELSKNLKVYIDSIKELAGIEIKGPKDLKAVFKDLEFKQDKYIENHPKAGKSDTPTPFLTTVVRICIYMGVTFNENMKLVHYATIQEEALKKYAKENNG